MITIKDIARMRIDYMDKNNPPPSRIVLSHYEYDCIRDELVYGDTASVIEMPSAGDYKGDGEIFGMKIYLVNDIEFKCMIG